MRDAAGRGLVAQHDAVDLDVVRADAAAETLGDPGVVVAGHPDPLAVLLHDAQDLELRPGRCARRRSTSCRLSPSAMTVPAA